MKHVLLVLALFAANVIWSQELVFLFKGQVENSDLGKNEAGVSISIVQGSSTIVSTSSASNGKYSLSGSVNYSTPFKVVFSKGGLVSKHIDFNLSQMNVEDIPPGESFKPVEALDMTMFKERDNVDFSFLKTEAVGTFDWNTRGMSIRLDQVEKNRVQTKILELLAKADKDKVDAEMKYQLAIQAADGFYNSQKYEEALEKYEEALAAKPQEKYPADRIVELDALIQAKKKAELAEKQENEEYYNLISAADALRDKDQLEAAIAKYKEAVTKKNEQYPKDQITSLTALIEQRKLEAENQALYDAVIKTADGFLKQNSLRAAKDKYTEAIKLKPSEKYPKDKLKEIELKMAGEAEKEGLKKKYDEAILEADNLFNSENYPGALAKYEEALKFESAATYPKERIKMCNDKMLEAKAQQLALEQIQKLINQGNTAISQKEWETAKGKFKEVLSLDASNEEAIEKLALVEQKISEEADLALQEAKFNSLVKEGDLAKVAKKFNDALSKYEEALTIKSTPEINTKISEIKALIAENEALANKEANFNNLMSEASVLLSANDLEGAKNKFQEASDVDPSKELPKNKIKEINLLLQKNKEAEAKKVNYEAAIAAADNLFNDSKLEESKAKYKEALSFDASESYPVERISEIDKLLAEKAMSAKKVEAYNGAIKAADNLFDALKWEEAKEKYRTALEMDPSQAYPIERIAEIDKLLEAKAIELKKLEKISALLVEGGKLYTQKKLNDAKLIYEEVLTLDSENKEAINKLNLINTELAALNSAAEKEEKFNLLKKEAFELASKEEYEAAKTKLKEALSYKTDLEVKNKLTEIEGILAAIQAKNELEANYNKLIDIAHNKESAKDYISAIEKYREAALVKPNESLPKIKIEELELLLNQASEEKEINARYAEFIQRGEELMSQKNYLDAIKEFNNALSIKPSEKLPVERAAEAERLEKEKGDEVDAQYEKILTVAQSKIDAEDYDKAIELLERAKKFNPTDIRPDQMLLNITELKKLNAEYEAIMKEADALAVQKKYENAKALYKKALNKKPAEVKPVERIAEMDKLIAEMSSAAEKEILYKDFMSKGNASESGKSYEQALSHYQNALSVKPGDAIAQNKINEIQQILDDISNSNAKEAELKNIFNALIKEADGFFSTEDYLNAKSKYEAALNIDGFSSYAKTQIDECVRLERLRSSEQEDIEYNKIIAAGDKYFDLASYDKAKGYYIRAISFKGNDPYPKQKLAEIDAILNPVTLASEKLEDLGDPFDNSIMDGQALLEKAEADRRLFKKKKITAIQGKIHDEETSMTTKKTQSHYDNSNEIYLVQQQITADAGESDLNRQATIEALKKSETERESDERDNTKFEHAENLSDQNILYVIQDETAMDYGERQNVYTENTSIMNAYETAQFEKDGSQVKMNYEKNIAADEDINQIKVDIDEGNRNNIKYEHASNLEDQNKLYLINNSTALEYGEKNNVYTENTDILKTYNTAQYIKINERVQTNYDKNITNDQELTDVKIKIDDGVRDDYAERAETAQQVVQVQKYATTSHGERTDDRYEILLANKKELVDVEEDVSNKALLEIESAKNNNEELIDVREKVNEGNQVRTDVETASVYKVNQEIAVIIEKSISDQQGLEENRVASNEALKKSEKELADANYNIYNDELEKYVNNKSLIENEVKVNSEITILADEAQAKKNEYVETMDKKARIQTQDGLEGDELERLNAKKSIDLVYIRNESNSTDEVKEKEGNTTTLADITKTIGAQETAKAIGENEKHYDTKEKIDNVESLPQQAPKVANALGEEYPEGVSQESFTRSDQNGLMTTIITRRVVVVNGHADVYIRTQSMNGITYSKNGKPSLLNVWQNETQGPHLERHY